MKEYLVEVFVQAGDGSIRDSFARQRIEVKVRAYDNQGAYQAAKVMFPAAKEIRLKACLG